MCIKLVIIKKLYYDARPTKYQAMKQSMSDRHNHKRRSNVVWTLRDFRLALLWDATQRRLIVNDVSGQPIGPTFKGSLKIGTHILSQNVCN